MTVLTDLAAIRARFLSGFDIVNIQTVYDNAPAQTINDREPWVRFGINPNDTVRETFGTSGIHSYHGFIWLQVFVPNDEGVKEAYTIASAFADVFRNWRGSSNNLKCGTESIRQVPNDEYYQLLVQVPYDSFA